jgi:HSP20 family molecular chaperone IbpA
VGIFKKIKDFVFGERAVPEDWNLGDEEEEEPMGLRYYPDYDEEPTLLCSENPVMPQEMKGGGNPERLNDITMREVQRINRQNRIPGQVDTDAAGRRVAAPPQGPRRLGRTRQAQMQQQAMAQKQLAHREEWEFQRQMEDEQNNLALERQRLNQERYRLDAERRNFMEQQREWINMQQGQGMMMQGQGMMPQGMMQPQMQMQQMQPMEQMQMQMQMQMPAQQMPQQQAQQDESGQSGESIVRVLPNYGEPNYEMIVANGKYHFFVDLPGVKEEDIMINYINMNLVITGTRKIQAKLMAPKLKGKGNKGKRPEFAAQVAIPPFVEEFNYSFYFPRAVVQDSFVPELQNGVLHVSMDILGENGPGGIQIKLGQQK